MKINHSIQPIYDENSKVLILGSIPSKQSRIQGFYYGHPKKRFWKVLAVVLNEPTPISIKEKSISVISKILLFYN